MGILIVAELGSGRLTDPTLEVIAEGRELADALAQPLWLAVPGRLPDDLGTLSLPVDLIYLLPLETLFSADLWVDGIDSLFSKLSPAVVLTPDSGYSRAWLPLLVTRVGGIPVGHALSITHQGDTLVCERERYRGLQREVVKLPLHSGPIFVTLKPGARGLVRDEPALAGAPSPEPITHQPPVGGNARDTVTAQIPPDMGAVDIAEAGRIVAGGLGLGDDRAVDLLWQLAEQIDGTVAGTRAISDRHWIPHERYIGSTGKIVRPALYIGLGISGASQHVVGMSDSEVVIAINIDRTAPIFGLADLGIVGDLHEIVPRLVEKIKRDRDKG